MKNDDFLPKAELKRRFNERGQRFTLQRERVWRLFESSPTGYTIAQATELLEAEGVGQSTVYRTVKTLNELGYLKWTHDQNQEHRFVASQPGHAHLLVCRCCGAAVECADCDLAALELRIAGKTGFAVEGHHLEFFGVCPRCLA